MVDHFIPVWLWGRERRSSRTRLESGHRAGFLRHWVDDRTRTEVIGLGSGTLKNHRVVSLLILLGSLEDVLAANIVIMFRRVSHWRCIYRRLSLRTDRERLLHEALHVLRVSWHELLAVVLRREEDGLMRGRVESRCVSLILLEVRLGELHARRGCQMYLVAILMIILILFGVVSLLMILFLGLTTIIFRHWRRVAAAEATSHVVVVWR